MYAQCEQVEDLVVEAPIESRYSPKSMRCDLELDDLTPFYVQNYPVIWLGAEEPSNEYVIEDPDDVELRRVPGYGSPSDSISVEFLADAVAKDKAGDLRAALAIIYRRVDEMVKLDMVDSLNDELLAVPLQEIGTDVLLGLLTATLPVKSKLASRPFLFKSTKRLLKKRGHYERGILDGLK